MMDSAAARLKISVRLSGEPRCAHQTEKANAVTTAVSVANRGSWATLMVARLTAGAKIGGEDDQ